MGLQYLFCLSVSIHHPLLATTLYSFHLTSFYWILYWFKNSSLEKPWWSIPSLSDWLRAVLITIIQHFIIASLPAADAIFHRLRRSLKTLHYARAGISKQRLLNLFNCCCSFIYSLAHLSLKSILHCSIELENCLYILSLFHRFCLGCIWYWSLFSLLLWTVIIHNIFPTHPARVQHASPYRALFLRTL